MSKHETFPDPRIQAHSPFGGSGASRVLACAGSVPLVGGVPPRIDDAYVREGKIAHALAAYCLARDIRNAAEFRGIKFRPWPALPDEEFTISKAMCESVQVYLNFCYELIDAAGKDGRYWIEVKFHLRDSDGNVIPDAFGTADFVIYFPRLRLLIVVDFKNGAGVVVGATENDQGKHYALGAMQELRALGLGEVDNVEIVIVQPNDWRNEDDAAAIRRWSTTAAEIELFGAEFEEAIASARQAMQLHAGGVSIEHLLKLGDHCGFCDAAPICPLKIREVKETAGVDSLDEITPARMADPGLLDPADLANALRAADVMEAWAKQVFKAASSLAQQGIDVPGYKLVDKVGRAKWIENEEEIADYLFAVYGIDLESLRPPSLCTITEAERLLKDVLKGDEFKEAKEDLRLRFTIKESSGTKLVPVSAKGEPVNAAQKAFGDVVINFDD